MRKRRTADSSSEENQISPVIVPSCIKRFSYKIIDLPSSSDEEAPVQLKRMPSVHAEEYASSAVSFLLGIQSEGLTENRPQDSSPQWSSYQECLLASKPPAIDLSEWPHKIENGPMKEGLNAEFLDAHPWIDRKLTFSKIANLRGEVFALKEFIDASTIAAAWVYFLALVNKGVVNKRNRKVFAAACVVIAFKFNEEVGDDFSGRMAALMKILRGLDFKEILSVKDILRKEFCAFSELNFSLVIGSNEFAAALQDVSTSNYFKRDLDDGLK